MQVSDSIRTFLEASKPTHNGHDLLDFYLSHAGLETQVNVAAGDGERVDGKRSTYTDGLNTWWAIRIPKKADSEPEWTEYDLKWALEKHAEGIGSTGWDWKARRSLYVGFDFDAIVGHAEGVGVSNEQLEEVKRTASALPWVEVRRSTGGAGLHLYVRFEGEGIPTANHTEHAALGRCILGLMSAETGYNFGSQIDVCGGNMWLWHRKSSLENKGLALLKAGECLPLNRIPTNWKDHVEVVTRRRAKTRVGSVPDGEIDVFEALASAHRVVNLDETHKEHIDTMLNSGFAATWVGDHHMLQAHTLGFKRLLEKYDIAGVFDTNAPGRNPQEPNCFAFPGEGGSWKIYRFGQGVNEHPTWDQDGQGWTTCWFNKNATLKVAARFLGGVECKGGGYEFDTLAHAMEIAKLLGMPEGMPVEEHLKNRKAVVTASKDGRLTIQIAKTSDDGPLLEGWNSTDKKNFWTRVTDLSTEPALDEITSYDDKIRCLETENGHPAGWAARKKGGGWTRKAASSVKMLLQRFGHPKPDAEVLMGAAEEDPWMLVSKPFEPDEPGDRQWNLDAPQLRYQPLPRSDDTPHPHWDMIFSHLGRDLDNVIRELPWAKKANIRTGADYLRAWFAFILSDPTLRLPYLFFFGSENCGKSILWEAFALLVTGGVVKADRALTSQSDFNGELAGAILCVIEEKDISKSPGAAAKIKDAVTGLTLSIRKMRTDSYTVVNLSHWIQTANHQDACAVASGDTRMVIIHVRPLEKDIPKSVLLDHLREEAPAFLRTLIHDIELPKPQGRLALDVVPTRHKARSEELSRSALESFIREQTFAVPGEMVPFKEFYDRFVESLPTDEHNPWNKTKVSKSLPVDHPCGAYTGNQRFVANLSFEPKEPAPDARLWILSNGKLIKDTF